MLEKLKRCDEGGQQQSSLRVTREPYLFLFFTFFFNGEDLFYCSFLTGISSSLFSYFFGCSAMSSSPFPSTAREHILWCFSSTFFYFLRMYLNLILKPNFSSISFYFFLITKTEFFSSSFISWFFSITIIFLKALLEYFWMFISEGFCYVWCHWTFIWISWNNKLIIFFLWLKLLKSSDLAILDLILNLLFFEPT